MDVPKRRGPVVVGNTFDGCGTGISVPADFQGEIGENTFRRIRGRAIEFRDRASLLETLGLPPDARAKDVRQLLEAIRKAPSGDDEIAAELSRRSRLGRWMARRAMDITALTANLTTIAQGPMFAEAMLLLR